MAWTRLRGLGVTAILDSALLVLFAASVILSSLLEDCGAL
jgi:hypothetical protein